MSKRIPLEMLNNTRDLGGIITKDGYRISSNRLLRSGELYCATPNDIFILKEHQLRTIIDLRTYQERCERPDPIIIGIKNISLSVIQDSICGISQEEAARLELEHALFSGKLNDSQKALQYTKEMYLQMITDTYSLYQYACFLNHLIYHKKGAILWHCAAGKDRAGLATIFLLECLGVDQNLIIDDYLLTDQYMQENIQNKLSSLNSMKDLAEFENVLSFLYGAKKEYIEVVYDTIEFKYKHFSAFLKKELNIDDSKIEILKNNYLTSP